MKVVSKVERSQQGEGRELAFIKMESSPGVADVYVPKSIFIGHDLEDWKRVRKGSVMEVMAHHMVRGSNRWRAATFLNLCTEEGSERRKATLLLTAACRPVARKQQAIGRQQKQFSSSHAIELEGENGFCLQREG